MSNAALLAELFGEVRQFVEVDLMGKVIHVPADNSLLRGFQFVAPEAVSTGRFCWNGSCMNCTVSVRAHGEEHKDRACRLAVEDGMTVVSVSPELRKRLTSITRPS